MKINKTILEHYFAALLIAGVSTWRTGHHDFKSLIWSPAIAVFGPVIIGAYNHFKTVANAPTK